MWSSDVPRAILLCNGRDVIWNGKDIYYYEEI